MYVLYLPNPATQCTPIEQPDSTPPLNVLLTSSIHCVIISSVGEPPSSNWRSCGKGDGTTKIILADKPTQFHHRYYNDQSYSTYIHTHKQFIWVNCWLLRDLNVPFGDVKLSGIGREGFKDSLEFYTNVKTVCMKH